MTDRPMSDERISSMSQIEELVERLKGPMPNRAAAVQDMKGVNVIEFDWLKIEAERNEAAAALTTLLRERDEARETLSKPKPIEPMDNTKMAIIRAAMLLRPLRVRGVNLSAREVLSLIERLRQAENWPTEWPPETF